MQYKKILPYAIAVVVFTIASLLYFNPVLSGKKIKQGDITQFIGMARESSNYRAEKGKESYWLGNAFSGMPTYQVGAYFPNDFIRYVDKAIRFLPRPADYLFLYFLSFFILLTALKVDWKLAILGSLSFGFSTYLIIIFGAGHNAKAHAIGYMPLVIAGIIYVYQKRYLLGFILTSLAIALEVAANHPQMTYYLGFCLLILGIVEFIQAIKNKTLLVYAKETGIILIACLLGIGVNATRLLATKEYAAHSTRGKSELTINADGTPKEKSSGLDKEYITEYSYGIAETFNLLIPRFMGGGTVEKLDGTSHFYETIEAKAGTEAAEEYSNQVLTYWGKQPIVEAPAYIGAILFFLFFLGIFLVKGKLKYWLVSATVFSIVMSWGKNFPIPTDLFIDYFPLYNKFRAVSSIQVIAELCVPLLGIIALRDFFSSDISKEEKENALKKSFYVVGGITLLLALLGGSLFDFEGIRDEQYQQLPGLIDALIADRKSMLMYDSLRSFMLVLITGGILWFFLKKKVNQTQVIVVLTIFIVFDLVSVNLNYVNKEDFILARNVDKPFVANEADKQILKDTTHYRVANFTGNILNEARTSYFHNSIGGYHAAKMKRYQEIFEYQISKNNFEVLNMLNTKYFIVGEDKVKENPEANGNAWFINQLILVNTADQEMKELDSLKTKTTAVLTKKEYGKSGLEGKVYFEKDSTAYVKLTNYDVARLTYKSASQKEQFAVFSEIYYQEGWNAYVDGNLMPHVRVDYILRGMKIPAGEHVIEFKFEPTVISKGSAISVIAYILLILIPIGGYLMMKKNKVA